MKRIAFLFIVIGGALNAHPTHNQELWNNLYDASNLGPEHQVILERYVARLSEEESLDTQQAQIATQALTQFLMADNNLGISAVIQGWRDQPKKWCCPYCHRWWPLGEKCQYQECPTVQWEKNNNSSS